MIYYYVQFIDQASYMLEFIMKPLVMNCFKVLSCPFYYQLNKYLILYDVFHYILATGTFNDITVHQSASST